MAPLSSGRLFSYLCSLPDGYSLSDGYNQQLVTKVNNDDNISNKDYQNNILLSKITDIVNKKEQYPQLVAKLEGIIIEYENKS